MREGRERVLRKPVTPPVMHKTPTEYAGMADCGTGMSVLEDGRIRMSLPWYTGYSSRLTDTSLNENVVSTV